MRDSIINNNSNQKYSRIIQYVIQKLFSKFYENVFHTSCLSTRTLKYLILNLLIKRVREVSGNDIAINLEM